MKKNPYGLADFEAIKVKGTSPCPCWSIVTTPYWEARFDELFGDTWCSVA